MQLFTLARNPIPSGAVAGSFRGHDGAPLRFARWEPTRGPRRGTVCCFTGRAETIEKYYETAADLQRRGFAVAMMDWRGQGGSGLPLGTARRGHIRDFSEYDRDLALFMRGVVLPDCPPPYIALAHSMGGNILLRNASVPGTWFERMVLSAPMIALHPDQIGASNFKARLYAEVWAGLGFGASFVRGGSDKPQYSAFEGNTLTTDRERWSRNIAIVESSPELALGSATIGWLRAAYRSMAAIGDPAYSARVKVPLLMFAAGADRIVLPRAIEDFATRTKLGTLVVLPASRHEILQEREDIRARFWSAFDAYLGVDQPAA